MAKGMFARGVCTCGRGFIAVQPERAEMAEKLKQSLGDSWDVFICNRPEAHCSKCGQAIALPVPEMLDPERHGMGELFEWIEGLENGTIKPEPGPENDPLFPKNIRPEYCTVPNVASCSACSLSNYGRDCQNNPIV